MKKNLLLITLILVPFFCVNALAFTSYNQGGNPNSFLSRGNPYKGYDPYASSNLNNPYNPERQPYTKKYIGKNYQKYSAHVRNHQFTKEGHVSEQIADPESIQNPYGNSGNPYNPKRYTAPYNPRNPNNPYNTFRRFYGKNTAYNSAKYSRNLHNDRGGYRGNLNVNPYNKHSYVNPYTNAGNQYTSDIHQFYGKQ